MGKVDRRKLRYNKQIYALYKGEKYIMQGTIRELAERRGVSESTMRYYRYESYLERAKGPNRIKLVALEGEFAE